MTPGERLQLTLQMIDEAQPFLFVGPPDVAQLEEPYLRLWADQLGVRDRLEPVLAAGPK